MFIYLTPSEHFLADIELEKQTTYVVVNAFAWRCASLHNIIVVSVIN